MPKYSLIAACLAAYASTLGVTEFFYDDQLIIASNPWVRQGLTGAWKLLTSGYWEATDGAAGAQVHYYRPVLMLTFWLQGAWAPGLHAVNLALHVGVALLLRSQLLRRMPERAAEAAALFYAVSPLHTEAVSVLTGRSEVLAALFLLLAWKWAEDERPWRACAAFTLGLLTKETVFLFPVLLALSERVFRRRHDLRLYLGLGLCMAGVIAARLAVLPRVVAGGVPAFESAATAALTVPRFWLQHYLLPALTGLGQCSDYVRPLIPDAGPREWTAWACLLAVVGLGAVGLWLCWRRKPAGFWIALMGLFLLPTSHLLVPLDTIGAERFLYIPLMGLAALMGLAYHRLRVPTAAGACIALWFTGTAFARNQTYRSREAYYAAAVSCNPVSARAWSSLGAAKLMRGDADAGQACLRRAVELDGALVSARYNLARFAYGRGDLKRARVEAEKALENGPRNVDVLLLAALIAEREGRLPQMRSYLERALQAVPHHPLAHYNLGRYALLAGDRELAERSFRRYLDFEPNDVEIQKLLQPANAKTVRSRKPVSQPGQ